LQAIVDVRSWAERNFSKAELGDRRRTQRLVNAAAKIAAHPQSAFTQIFDWNELRGFYRVCDQKQATLQAVLQPHWQQTRQALEQRALALIVHDTTELDFTTHPHLVGAGPIGDGGGRGFLQHNSLALVPQPREVLGLAYQQLRTRQPRPEGDNSYRRKQRPRESDLWLHGIRGLGPAPEGCCWVDVADCACDIYEAMQAALALGHHFLFRARENRVAFADAAGEQRTHLMDHARSLASQGTDRVAIAGRGGRPSRTARVCLAGAALWVPAPHGTRARWSQPRLRLWVIRIWEPHPPAGVEEPLEWILLCSLPTATLAELKERRDWYCCRWMAEVYHDIEKNGCSQEARRFRTAERMETCLALLSVVAVRVFQMRCALEAHPEAPAEQVATHTEIEVVRRFLQDNENHFTVRRFVHGVAKLGGFLGRRGDGDPGVRALWRGYQRLQDFLLGYNLHAIETSDSP